ncbi:MAG: hypothetical protein LAP87_28085 [Acidobacteriia bacterium]|nr:hypothetical protein [Terriglobia bacterium]
MRLAIACLLFLRCIVAQSQLPLDGISVIGVDLDVATGTFKADIVNNTGLDVSGGSYRVDVTFLDGTSYSWHNSFDLLYSMVLEKLGLGSSGATQIGVLHPGQAYHVAQPVQRGGNSGPVVLVAVTPASVVYVGGVADGDEADIVRLFRVRAAIAAEASIWVKEVTAIRNTKDLADLGSKATTDYDAMRSNTTKNTSAGRFVGLRDTGVLQSLMEMSAKTIKRVEARQIGERDALEFIRAYLGNLAAVAAAESARKEAR